MSIDTLMDWGKSDVTQLPYNGPRKLDIKLYRNTSWINTIPFTGTDISGYDFTLTVKRNAFDNKSIKTLRLGDGLSVTGIANDNLSINTLVDFPSGAYVYDLKSVKPDGEIAPSAKGKIKVEEDV